MNFKSLIAQALMQAVPLKASQLQFHQAKENLDKKFQEVEAELAEEHQALKDGQPSEEVMSRHMVSAVLLNLSLCVLNGSILSR